MALLSVPLPRPSYLEIALVVPAKLTIPFAVSGVLVLWGLTIDPGFDYYRALFLHENVADLVSTKAPLPIGGALLIVAMSCFVGPVVEELLFRGLLYRTWERQWGWIPATFLTSAVFAFYHPTHVTSTFIGSLVFICLFRRTGSLRAPIIVHCLFNMLVSIPCYQELVFVKPRADAAILANWTFELTCLAFMIVALPAYIWAARAPRLAGRA
jgi:membrane protease YdiL (CAAX protease family)